MPILDNFFLEGWPAIYRISIALMDYFENNFLSKKKSA